METKEQILKILKNEGKVTASVLSSKLGISDRYIRKMLSELLLDNKVEKTGTPPIVYYFIVSKESKNVTPSVKKVINDNYLYVSSAGEYYEGLTGFVKWCEKTNQDVSKTAKEYVETIKKYIKYKDSKTGLINGMSKLKSTYSTIYLDKVFYIDFYSIERFGKTKLGQILLYAKQSQDLNLIKKAVEMIRPSLEKVIVDENIDGICYVPPTVKRQVQLMEESKKLLGFKISDVSIDKVKTEIIVPQKTLSKVSDRVANAEKTFVVTENRIYKNILIIDDAVGSGATLNEIAKKIREKEICKGKIIGVAMTGSFKGFDVISEI